MSLYIPNNASLLAAVWAGLPTQDTTLMGWVLFPVANANYRVVMEIECPGTPAPTNDQVMIATAADGQTISFGTHQSSNYVMPMSYGVWYHLCQTTRNPTATSHFIDGYINGKQMVGVQNTTTFTTATYVVIGNWIVESDAVPLYGNIRDFRMWTRALSASEVRDEYRSSVPVHREGLFISSKFDTNIYTDESGNGNLWGAGGSPSLGENGPILSYPKRGMSRFV
jgi:hypothetical protein